VRGILKSAVISQGLLFFLMLIPFSKSIVRSIKREYVTRMLSFGLPLVPSALAMWILTLLDRYFLKVFTSMEVVGIYSLGYKVAMIMSMLIVIPFSMAWGPLMLKWKNEDRSKVLYSKTFKYYAIVGFFFVLSLSLLSKELIQIMTTSPYYSAYRIVFLIALSYMFHGFYMIFTAGCTFYRKTFYFAIATGSAALLNTVLNIVLIPHFQMMGAAAATAISYFSMMILMYFFSERFYHIPFEFRSAIKLGFITTALFLGGIFIEGSLVFTILVKVAILIIFFASLFVFRVFTRSEIEGLKKIIGKRK
jgi:O-antigen/teichoic acid export membrane protein